MVVNVEGFIKYSNIFEGNMTESESLPKIIDNLRQQTSSQKRAVVVIDAGITTEDNLAIIQQKGYDYVCVSRSKIKYYSIKVEAGTTHIVTKNKQVISLQKVNTKQTSDYVLRVKSPGKEAKERSMKSKFEARFIESLKIVSASLDKKGGVKKLDKVNRRIGRVIEKYPSIAKYYDIEVESENNKAIALVYTQKESYKTVEQELGSYFIRTNLDGQSEINVWTIYNAIREVESTFRCLKTDLDLRPIYHKNDNSTMAHLHLRMLGYWLVNTIRYQLKKSENHSWQEVIRITNTQKIVTTTGQNKENELIYVRRCTETNEKVRQIYTALNYKNYPFVKRKFVVLKSEVKNHNSLSLWEVDDG